MHVQVYELSEYLISALLTYRGQLSSVYRECVDEHKEDPHFDRVIQGYAAKMATGGILLSH